MDAIAKDPAPATFENTFVPLEDAGRKLNRIAVLFSVMTNNVSTPEYQALDVEWSPKLAARLLERSRPLSRADQKAIEAILTPRLLRTPLAREP